MTQTRPTVYDFTAMPGHDSNDGSTKSASEGAVCSADFAVLSEPREPSITRLYEPMELPGGWSGLILTEYHGRTPTRAEPSRNAIHGLPTAQHWCHMLKALIEAPSELADYTLLKYSGTGEVFRATLDWPGGLLPIVAKQSRVRGWLQRTLGRARSYFAPGTMRARRNFRRALDLLDTGVDTAMPLALIERRGTGVEAWLVSEYIEGLVDLDHVVTSLLARLEPARQRKVRNRLIECVAALLSRLERGKWFHRDLKASNILLTHWDEPTARVWLLDLDGLRRQRAWEHAADKRALVRLAASLLHHSAITSVDFARFLRRYLVLSGGSDSGWKEAFQDIARRARTYDRQAAVRKMAKLDGFDA